MSRVTRVLFSLGLLLVGIACGDRSANAPLSTTTTAPPGTPLPPATATVPPPPDVFLEDDVLNIVLAGFEESCISPFEVYVDDAGEWLPGDFLPYQGDYFLDGAYVDQPWQDEGCDVLGECVPWRNREIVLADYVYHFLEWRDRPEGEGRAAAYMTLSLSNEIWVEVNYFIDDECRRLAHFETVLIR